jgi:hypothetical protein
MIDATSEGQTAIPPAVVAHGIIARREEPLSDEIADGVGGAPVSVCFSRENVEQAATKHIVYACNLPGKGAPAGTSGIFPNTIEPGLEFEFLAGSLPGGQVAIFAQSGKRGLLRLRWLCLTEHSSIGSVWRCFLQTCRGSKPRQWIALEHDYLFDADGYALNLPNHLEAGVEDDGFNDLMLHHPEGSVTCFPCRSGLVKVTCISADGCPSGHLPNPLSFA